MPDDQQKNYTFGFDKSHHAAITRQAINGPVWLNPHAHTLPFADALVMPDCDSINFGRRCAGGGLLLAGFMARMGGGRSPKKVLREELVGGSAVSPRGHGKRRKEHRRCAKKQPRAGRSSTPRPKGGRKKKQHRR